MRYKALMIVIVLVAFASALPAQTKDQDLTLDKIVEMTKAGLSPETIINTIINSETSLTLTVDQVMYLKEQGVHEDVINFILRTRPLPEDTAGEAVVNEQDVQAEDTVSEELPEYVADAAEGNYYDGYEYTDGYNYEDDRYTPIIYHYYGPWFRAYPYYYGFYYYPSSYYYYCYWPDDFYYYYYYPRFVSWRYYYYYPSWYHYYPRNHNYYYYSGGRYTRAPHGRYIYRSGDRVRYAVPRNHASGTPAVRSRTVTSTRGYSSVIRSRNDGTGVTRTRAPNDRSTTSIRTRSGVTSRSKSSTIRSTIYGKRPQPSITKPRTRSATPRSYSRPRTSGYTPKISRPSSSSRSRSYSSPGSSRSRSKSYSTPKRSSSSRPSTSSRSRSSSSSRSAVSRSSSSSSGKKKH